ncbi:hypothetical protein QVD17_36536 [Tagetes erecta]|uniref:Uncharacterized protein n=1 Tax=Tagetes erecta TaxID=13708 RepID=A0AAD8JSL9_TARER|nr:hypothetical protein QVD17_36536 [Tagetes erecta]
MHWKLICVFQKPPNVTKDQHNICPISTPPFSLSSFNNSISTSSSSSIQILFHSHSYLHKDLNIKGIDSHTHSSLKLYSTLLDRLRFSQLRSLQAILFPL